MRRRWVVAVVALLVLAVGVPVVRHLGSGGGPGAAAAPPPSYDPPSTFDDGPGTPLPQAADADPLPGVLNGFDAFLAAPDALQVIDTRSGQLRASVTPVTAPSPAGSGGAPTTDPAVSPLDDGADPRPPVLATLRGRPVVIAVFGARIAGHGTTVGHDGVRVVAVDAASYATVTTGRIDLPVSLTGRYALREAWAVGVSGSTLVIGVQLGPDRTPAGYAIDLAAGQQNAGQQAAGQPAWHLEGFTPTAVVGPVVTGSTADARGAYRVAGVGVTDGRRIWTAAGDGALTATVWPAGPTLIGMTSTEAGTGRRALTMLDAATGAVRSTQDSQGGVSCRYDERSITICYQALSGDSWVAGFDATTGRRLWQLPDGAAGRIAPRVSTAWHGVVYGSTDSGTVALDARTGADRPAAPKVAPDLVNAYVGVSAATVSRPRATAHLARS
jgi:PQQ-like domain